MRQIRVGEQRSRIADDVRAGLTTLGRGDSVFGGIALVDPVPPGAGHPLEAVVVMPHGVLIIAGVDLPGPAMHLDAPLHGQWKADNWPLVGSGDAVNPGSLALGAADRLARRITAEFRQAIPVAAVLAVGPYVDTVTRDEADAAQPVRVLYPTGANLREAIAAMLPADGPACSVEQARAVLRLVVADVPVQNDSELVREGFVAAPKAAHPAQYVQPAPEPAGPTAAPQPPVTERKRDLRVLPIAAILLIVAGVIAAIVMAAGGAKGSPSAQAPLPSPAPEEHTIAGVTYTEVATDSGTDCAAHTFGDVRATVEKLSCSGIRLGSFQVESEGKRGAVSVAELELTGQDANKIAELAETPGAGGASDLATGTNAWPDGTVSFDNAAYRANAGDNTVRLVRASWVDEPSSPDDKELRRIAEAAFDVPLES